MSRMKIGESDDRGRRQNSFSKRASLGKLDVVKSLCKFCGHHKALHSVNVKKCSRCKRVAR